MPGGYIVGPSAERTSNVPQGVAIPRGLIVLGCAFVIVALNFFALGSVGYLSDDLLQLERVRQMSWFEPIVPHHLAPLLTLMYMWANAGLSVDHFPGGRDTRRLRAQPIGSVLPAGRRHRECHR